MADLCVDRRDSIIIAICIERPTVKGRRLSFLSPSNFPINLDANEKKSESSFDVNKKNLKRTFAALQNNEKNILLF